MKRLEVYRHKMVLAYLVIRRVHYFQYNIQLFGNHDK